MNEQELARLLTTYYRQPRPDRVPEALAWYAASSMGRTPVSTGPMVYFFARVAQMHPAMIEHYQAARGNVPTSGVAFIDRVLDLASRCHSRESLLIALREMTFCEVGQIRTVLASLPIDAEAEVAPQVLTCLEMDCLWAEFCTTGDAEALLPVIAVLGWPDLVRHKLNDWLSAGARSSPVWYLRWRGRRVLRRVGLAYDQVTGRVGNLEDVDCLCAIQSMCSSNGGLAKIRTAVPFELTVGEQTYIAVKAVAKWSLWSNVTQHPRILELCRQRLAVENLRARISLADIVQAGDRADRLEYAT
jgi:hypothetical protein